MMKKRTPKQKESQGSQPNHNPAEQLRDKGMTVQLKRDVKKELGLNENGTPA